MEELMWIFGHKLGAGTITAASLMMGGLIGVFVASMVVVSLAQAVLSYIAAWRIFQRSGDEGWKCLIPVYNSYTFYKIFWKPAYFWWSIVLVFAAVIGQSVSSAAADSYVLSLIASLLSLAAAIVAVVWEIKLYHKMSRAFGRNAGFTVGLIFLPVIFMLILGFGTKDYIAAGEEPAAEE